MCAKIELAKINTPAIFDLLMRTGNIERDEMFHVFNMGVGMVLIVNPDNVDEILRAVKDSYVVGEIINGAEKKGGILLA